MFFSARYILQDSNYIEQAIRPFTIGRKNFVMIESSNSAKASAILYRLVETTKANMANTFEYFNLLLTEIPQHIDDKDLIYITHMFVNFFLYLLCPVHILCRIHMCQLYLLLKYMAEAVFSITL